MKAFRGRWSRRLMIFLGAEPGAAMAELAVAFPFLLLLAIGAIDYGRIHSTTIAVANAARAGAQYGAQSAGTSGDNLGMISAAQNDAGDATLSVTPGRFCKCPDGSSPNCSTGSCGAFGAPEVYVTTAVTEVANLLIRYPGLASTVTITRTAILRVQ